MTEAIERKIRDPEDGEDDDGHPGLEIGGPIDRAMGDSGANEIESESGVRPFFYAAGDLREDEKDCAEDLEDGEDDAEIVWIAKVGDAFFCQRAVEGEGGEKAVEGDDEACCCPVDDLCAFHMLVFCECEHPEHAEFIGEFAVGGSPKALVKGHFYLAAGG